MLPPGPGPAGPEPGGECPFPAPPPPPAPNVAAAPAPAAAQVPARAPHALGGLGLLGKLRVLECPAAGRPGCTAGEAGLFKSTTKDGGFPNVVTQALAVLALSRSTIAGDHPDDAAVAFLLG